MISPEEGGSWMGLRRSTNDTQILFVMLYSLKILGQNLMKNSIHGYLSRLFSILYYVIISASLKLL